MDLENQYYNSKALKDDDPKAALDNFQKVFLTLLLLNTTCPVLANSVDPDQLASEEAN